MSKTKKFTILHNNDIHGDFLAEVTGKKEGKLIGGLALLSGYINKVRREEKNVLYVISGDMVQGSLIDAEYKGVSTMEIMNYLAPDVVALGNHEFDYGLPHLLFLEKLANFPIVNANLYIKKYHKRLMKPYEVVKKDGFDILFTGIITEKIMDALKMDKLVGSFVSLEEASHEVGKICNAYKNDDIDLTILLTHIGYESDIELAKILKPEWGVDMIIGGHSHTILDKPTVINNILISQVGVGSDQIGRFDIVVDDETNSIINYNWQLIPITSDLVEPDRELEKYINTFKKDVDRKYSVLVTKFAKPLTHPKRETETTLGNLVADALAENAQTDVMLVGSGSIRVKEMGPLVTRKDFLACFPYDDSIVRFEITGKTMLQIFAHIMRPENRNSEGECYQVNSLVKAKYSDADKKLTSLEIDGRKVSSDSIYTIAMQNFHFANCQEYLGVTDKELNTLEKQKTITTSVQQVLEEWLKTHQNQSRDLEKRLEYT
jgi:5'-nucleotidase / UDP-sugar diphosphatase